MFQLGGSELLLICAIIGGVVGYFKRNKNRKNGALIGIILGVVGSIAITILLITFLFQSYLAMPVYAIFGAWLFNYIWSKFQKEEEPVS
ncbi:hypothetical protein SAMN05428988_6154 [Chitinophaga sp. YR573]|uniref:DUF5518 domain-containing protein n=1 Tax=Chitinophaga sp. YR573 TaxID=1881040 RepID=UPI0008B04E6B|nr:DUF5518 domain-containing protein [Chitinophaga sp. YR573]SEW45858.1 hypothetical protein SAMN05428988_6154 [Chitinophaga sp. YR573]